MSKKDTLINMAANIAQNLLSILISFVLTRYIVQSLGADAYGFIGLSNNFVTYIAIITTALNAMASRFVSLCVFKGDIDGANKYFSSTVIANIVLSAILFVPSALVVVYIDKIVNVPVTLVFDVKWLFALTFFNMLFSIVFNIFQVGVFIKNKLYLNSLRTLESQLIKGLLLVLLFSLFTSHVWYIGLATVLTSCYVVLYNINYKKKFLPDIKVEKKYFDFKAVKTLLASGVWNSFMQLTSVLSDGLDLVIANLFLGSTLSGILAITKIIPTGIGQFNSMVGSVFSPKLYKLYAENNINNLVSYMRKCNRLTGYLSAVPLAGVIVFGREFFALYVPGQNLQLLWILSCLSITLYFIASFSRMVFEVFVVTNKLKLVSLISFAAAALNIPLVIILLNTTDLGLYAVAGVSGVLNVIRYLLFNPIYAAHCLGIKRRTFYPDILFGLTSIGIMCIIGFVGKGFFPADTLITFIMGIAVFAVIGYILNLFVILRKSDRAELVEAVEKTIKKVGQK